MKRKGKAPDAFPGTGLAMPVEFWALVDRGDQELEHALKWIAAGEKCGVDCSLPRQRAKQLSDRLSGFRSAFAREP